jgi:DNA-binding IclR family transcriptional regulator
VSHQRSKRFRHRTPPSATAFYDAPTLPAVAPPASRPQQPVSYKPHASKLSSDYQLVSFSDAEYEKSVVKSAHRALQVFLFLAEYHRPATASDIAVNRDFPRSSTSMLLRSLVELGYLRYCSKTRRYSPSIRLSFLVAGWQPEGVESASAILAVMQQLNRETGECVTLAEQYRHHVRYIYVVQSTGPEKMHYVPHGTLRPIVSTASGQMLLTLKSDRELKAIVHRARSQQESIDYGISLEEVVVAVQRWRSLGYAYTSRLIDDTHTRTYQLAALLSKRGDNPPLSIGITSHGNRLVDRQHQIVTRLLELVGKLNATNTTNHILELNVSPQLLSREQLATESVRLAKITVR